jgi:hypothetical protein
MDSWPDCRLPVTPKLWSGRDQSHHTLSSSNPNGDQHREVLFLLTNSTWSRVKMRRCRKRNESFGAADSRLRSGRGLLPTTPNQSIGTLLLLQPLRV